MTNSIVWDNISNISGNPLGSESGGSYTISNSIVEGGGFEGGVDEDPLFIDPDEGNYIFSIFN